LLCVVGLQGPERSEVTDAYSFHPERVCPIFSDGTMKIYLGTVSRFSDMATPPSGWVWLTILPYVYSSIHITYEINTASHFIFSENRKCGAGDAYCFVGVCVEV
jgi:hypothetical protein